MTEYKTVERCIHKEIDKVRFYINNDCDDVNRVCRDCGKEWYFRDPYKKVYKLSEMWKVWCDYPKIQGLVQKTHFTLSAAKANANTVQEFGAKVLAITRADATEFYEGEGLNDL